jgi:HEPN domain-containing protein
MTDPTENEEPSRLTPVEDANEWFKFANNDFTTVMLAIKEEEPPLSTICYLCQQAAEKYLKGYLISKGWILKRLHDLSALLAECQLYDRDFEALRDAVITLNPYSVEARYPGDRVTDFSGEDAKTAAEKAEEIIEFVKQKLEKS